MNSAISDGAASRRLRRALILGGAGFMGSWVTDELTAADVETTVLGYGARRPGDLALPITCNSVEEVLASADYDAVFFLAGSPSVPRSVREPSQDLHDNTGLVVDVLEALRASKAPPVFVFVSSAAVYGDSQREPMGEDHPLLPRSPYGISKLAAEHYVRLYAETYGIPAVSARPFSVYGPRQYKLVVYDLLARLLDGEDPLVVESSAEVARDFVFVGDVARALVELASRAPADGEPYNVASGASTTLDELTQQLVNVTGLQAEVRFTGSERIGDPFRWRGDPRRAARLGIFCSTPLADGLRQTAEWVSREIAAQSRR